MKVLGIEGTAHTIGAGVVDDKSVLSSVTSVYRPESGGIHPREAAVHHSENAHLVISEALRKADVSISDVDLISFSMGPGLGPCLRVVATAARALAISHNKEILGVNHPLGHVEIGRFLSGANDPVMLYVSGGNTQVIAHKNGRYRVFGETTDIGLGNMLDKLARDLGFPFPGGPKIESLSRSGKKLLDLPYSVKGMDTSFSGIYTAAKRYREKGEKLEDICYSLQETSFSMLVEVTERALDYLGKDEVLLAGGVARNARLREMFSIMAEETGAVVHLTDPEYCMDNGAMIARAGQLMYANGARQSIDETSVQQRYRIDDVEVPWIHSRNKETKLKGAEATLRMAKFLNKDTITKSRIPKKYRVVELDMKIRSSRMRNEVSIAEKIHNAGLNTPLIYSIDFSNKMITMAYIPGKSLRDALVTRNDAEELIASLSASISKMHDGRIAHGDLTTSNVLNGDVGLYLIDGSLGEYPAEEESLAQDLFLLKESFSSMHGDIPGLWELFRKRYSQSGSGHSHTLSLLTEIEKRRRYV